jgi:hypothetical protein
MGGDQVRGSLRCGIATRLMSARGQNPLLPRRNIDSRFTSITGHNVGAITCAAAE